MWMAEDEDGMRGENWVGRERNGNGRVGQTQRQSCNEGEARSHQPMTAILHEHNSGVCTTDVGVMNKNENENEMSCESQSQSFNSPTNT